MNNKLFSKGLFAAVLISVSAIQFAAAQDTTKKAVVPKTIPAKPKAVATQPGTVKPTSAYPKTTTPATATAQQPYTTATASVAPTDRSINGQYQYLLSKTYGYQRPMISAFYKSLTDSLNNERKKIKPLQTSVATLQDTVKDLHKQLAAQSQVLSESTTKVDNISLLGINMTKSAYNTLMWGLVIAFGAIAAIVIVRSGSNSREAKYRIKLYEDLDEEYKSYKAKANEKEKKLARELQTARNKIEEITGNPY